MHHRPTDVLSPGTRVLLVEVNPDARAGHGATLTSCGYTVTLAEAWPSLKELNVVAVLISDVASFLLLRGAEIRRLPPVVVLADDPNAGVSACLCGADAWVPTHGDGAYLVDTIDGLVRGLKSATMEAH